MPTPDVSIVIATYNRSAVLRHVLDVLRMQTVRDWEALVIGDGCTDDTEAMVASFDERRFRFLNLPRNHGEQSAPNNEGVRLSRGRTVAYLNHDDLWRPDHLEHALTRLEHDGCDLVYSWTANLLPDETVVLLGVSPGGAYSPAVVVPASAWVLRRELAERTGPWRNGWTIHLPPSQDWLFRAFRAGARIRELSRLSVIGFPSGARRGSYAAGDPTEQERWRVRIASEPAWPEELLARYIETQAAGGRLPPAGRLLGQLSWVAKNASGAAVARMGLHPLAVRLAIRHPGRGGFLTWLRRQRGLPARGTHTR